MSWVVPLGGVEDAVVEQIGIGVVAVDFEHLGDEPASGPSFHLHNEMQRIRDVGFDGASAFFQERCVATDSTVNFEPLPFV